MGLAGRVVFHVAFLSVKGTCCPLCRECFLYVWISRAQHGAWAYSRCSANVCWELSTCNHSGKFSFFLNVHFTDGETGTRTQCWWWPSWGWSQLLIPRMILFLCPSPCTRLWSMCESRRKPHWISVRLTVLDIWKHSWGHARVLSLNQKTGSEAREHKLGTQVLQCLPSKKILTLKTRPNSGFPVLYTIW